MQRLTKKLALFTFIFLLAIAFYNLPTHAVLGCCCNPVTKEGSFLDSSPCAAKNFTFVNFVANNTCDQLCNVTAVVPTIPPIGLPPTACGSPIYKPAPLVSAAPVRGEKDVKLTIGLPCPADFINISRCQGSTCNDFQQLKRLSPVSSYVDIIVLVCCFSSHIQ